MREREREKEHKLLNATTHSSCNSSSIALLLAPVLLQCSLLGGDFAGLDVNVLQRVRHDIERAQSASPFARALLADSLAQHGAATVRAGQESRPAQAVLQQGARASGGRQHPTESQAAAQASEVVFSRIARALASPSTDFTVSRLCLCAGLCLFV